MDDFQTLVAFSIVVAVVALETFTHIRPGTYWALLLYVTIISGLKVRHEVLRFRTTEEKRLVYRSLAEALRLEAVWRYAGVQEMVSSYYSRHARNEVEWVRQAVRGLFPCGAPLEGLPSDWQRIEQTKRFWIDGQARFFEQNARKLSRLGKSTHSDARTLFGLGMGILVLLLGRYYFWHAGAAHDGHLDHLTHLLGAAAILAFASSGVLQWIDHMRAYGPLARRYESQGKTFERASVALERLTRGQGKDLAEARQLLADLGIATLMENTSWLLLFRNRPLEIHVP
jgi:hypothetical protein